LNTEIMDIAKFKKAYLIGIKGSGMVAVAEIFVSLGMAVTGSDTKEKFFTDEVLEKLGIKYFEKFSAENIPNDADLVIFSTAYNESNNIELAEAKKRNLPILSYPEILGKLFNEKYGIAVCGTHGKTTTAAMLSSVMKYCGADPTAVIGSRVIGWGSNALVGKGEFFVLEADEFQNKLKLYEPKAAVLTSIDWDHPDFYPTFAEYKKAFSDFAAKIPKYGFLVCCGDDANVAEIGKSARCAILKYGFGKENDFIIIRTKKLIPGIIGEKFEVVFKGKGLGKFEIKLSGRHNVSNAAAVIAVGHKIGLNLVKVKEALGNFQGTSRRFEYVGERNGAVIIDDYGHHPEEIKATLKSAREIYPEKNIIAVFHPHSYSRTEALLAEFAQSFGDANKVIVLDIYGSAREKAGKVSSKDLVSQINKYDFGKAEHIATIKEAVDYLKDKIGQNDIVLCIGAGNVFEVAEKLKSPHP